MRKELYKKLFEGKKITIMGLGLLGRGIQVTKFLAECGAQLTVTDLKSEKDLETSINSLKKYKIRYVLGKHDLKDFEKVDMVIKSAGVPLDSPFIQHARSMGVDVSMDASLFAKIVRTLDQDIRIVGITGTRGKSMTTAITYHLLKENEKKLGCKVYIGGNMRMKATLPLLTEVEAHDIVVLELDSWQCQGFGDEKISPEIAVFTSFMPDHMNYYKDSMPDYLSDKSNIYKFQKLGDYFITNKAVLKILKNKPISTVIMTDMKKIAETKLQIFGEHNRQNAAHAYEVAKIFKLPETAIKRSMRSFDGLEGRLQNISELGGIHVINDNNATTPEATAAGIEAVRTKYKKGNILLLAGGADKKLDLMNMVQSIKKHCSHTILLSGTGTERLKTNLKEFEEYSDFKKAILRTVALAKKGDVILFSPGFASFGLFLHEYDRNDQFIKIIKNLEKKWK